MDWISFLSFPKCLKSFRFNWPDRLEMECNALLSTKLPSFNSWDQSGGLNSLFQTCKVKFTQMPDLFKQKPSHYPCAKRFAVFWSSRFPSGAAYGDVIHSTRQILGFRSLENCLGLNDIITALSRIAVENSRKLEPNYVQFELQDDLVEASIKQFQIMAETVRGWRGCIHASYNHSPMAKPEPFGCSLHQEELFESRRTKSR